MAIRIQILAAFEGGIPLSERNYLTDKPGDPDPRHSVPSPVNSLEVTDLAHKILQEITLALTPSGSQPISLHPVLKAALTQDVTRLASYLLRSTGNEWRSLLTL